MNDSQAAAYIADLKAEVERLQSEIDDQARDYQDIGGHLADALEENERIVAMLRVWHGSMDPANADDLFEATGWLLEEHDRRLNDPKEDQWLVLSLRHSPIDGKAAWWAPDSRGYTTLIRKAGRYTEEHAKRIERESKLDNIGYDLEEVAVPFYKAHALAERVVDYVKARKGFVAQ